MVALELLMAIVEGGTDLAAVVDTDYRYLLCNEAYRKANREIFGVDVEVGRGVIDCLSGFPRHAHRHRQLFRRALAGEQAAVINEYQDLQGRLRVYEGAYRPLRDPDGRIVAAILLAHDVTARVIAERTLRESEARFRRVVEHMRDALMVDDIDGNVVFANDRFLELFGFTRDALRHLTLEDYVAPEYRQQLRARHDARVRGEAQPTTYEYEGLRRDGTRIWLEVDVVPICDETGRVTHTQSAIRDISARKDAEQALRHNDRMLRAIMEHVPEGVTISDANGVFVMSSKAGVQLVGRASADNTVAGFIGSNRAYRGDGVTVLAFEELPLMRAITRGEIVMGEEVVLKRADGVVVPLLVNAAPILDEEGRISGGILAYRDISDRKRAEKMLRETDRRKDEFIAVLSHELRNPLAPIRYALPVIQEQKLDGAAGRAVAVIQRQVEHLTRLVDDLLDVSRITHGKIELRREQVALGAIIRSAAEAAAPNIVAGRHNLHITIGDDPIWLVADAARVSQVVTNLLNNAARYTPRGGDISVEAGREGEYAVIRVRDNGRGLPPEALATVFEMFQQATSGVPSHGGLGIGLGLARQLVEMHEGMIEAHSAGLGKGAEFVVRLPAARERIAADMPAAPMAEAETSRQLKVLVVDDNADLVDMLAILVEATGHEVRKALDGQSAISAALSWLPDVVLLDLGLPGLTGLDVARELRSRPEGRNMRLVALTGWGQAEDRRRTSEAGFDEHLTKPTDPQTLQELLAAFAAELPS